MRSIAIHERKAFNSLSGAKIHALHSNAIHYEYINGVNNGKKSSVCKSCQMV